MRVGPTETRGRRGASGRGESEGREDEIRRARGDYFVERTGERVGGICKDGERGGEEEERGEGARVDDAGEFEEVGERKRSITNSRG